MTREAEQQLVERCRAGDDEAFRELVDQYKSLVFALLTRSVTDRARVEDLAQDIFLKIHRGLPYFRGEARLSTWIYRIALNLVSEEKSARRMAAVSLDDDRETVASLEPVAIDTHYSSLELRDRIAKAMERLPANYRLLINGHYLEGMNMRNSRNWSACRWAP